MSIEKPYNVLIRAIDLIRGKNNGVVNASEILVEIQKHGYMLNQWISVKDYTPDNDSEVFVSLRNGGGVLDLDYSSQYFQQIGFWLNENGGEYQHDYNSKVSHWQYKPESATTPEGVHNYQWKDNVMEACSKCYMTRFNKGKAIQYMIWSQPIKKELPCDKQAQLDLDRDKIK